MNRRIKKAKLKSRTLEVELTETIDTENGPISNEVNMKCTGLVHDDLRKAFQRLALHMIIICDLKKSDCINPDTFEREDLSEFEDYEVKGFTIGGQDEHQGIVINGQIAAHGLKCIYPVNHFLKYASATDSDLRISGRKANERDIK